MKILLVVYDSEVHTSMFPMGIAYIAAACRGGGHDVRIYNQNVYHWDDEHLTHLLDRERFDVVGLGACGGYFQYRKTMKIAEAVNRSKKRPLFLLGGHLASPEPEYFLRKTGADIVVIGEGEETITDLLDSISRKRQLSDVKGIAFMDGGKCIRTPRRPLIKDIDALSFPAWDLFPMEHYVMARLPNMRPTDRFMNMITGRGCPFKCNFCYRMDEGFRPRSPESIIEEIGVLKKDYSISYMAFMDELLMSSVERTATLCESFIKARIGIRWFCSGRLNYAKPDILKLMKEAGCVFISYGIESLDDAALRNMNKALTVKQIISGIENTKSAGISPGYNIIFGNIGETAESLRKGVDFLLRYDDHDQVRTIRPVTPYPGSPLYYHAIEKGLLKDCADFYEKKHVNSDLMSVNFTEMTEEEYYDALHEANLKLLDNYYKHQQAKTREDLDRLYSGRDVSFRGFRHI